MEDLSQMEQIGWHTHDGINTPRIFSIQPAIENSTGAAGDDTRAINEVISMLEKIKIIRPNTTP